MRAEAVTGVSDIRRRCHKLAVSIRRSHGCSTDSIRVGTPLFKGGLNKEIRRVEHECWIMAVFWEGSLSDNLAKIDPILRPMDGNLQVLSWVSMAGNSPI